jgi:hypothetical protein
MLKRMTWEGHVAHMAAQKSVDNFGEKIKAKDSEDLDADEPIILKWNFRRVGG